MNNAIVQRKSQFRETLHISLHEIVLGLEKYETLKKAERDGTLQNMLGISKTGLDFFNLLTEDLNFQDSIFQLLKKEMKTVWKKQSKIMKNLLASMI